MKEMLHNAWLGTRLICPVCGRGRIYRSLSAMNADCPHCGTVFEPDEGDFLGAMIVAYCVTAVLVSIGICAVEFVTSLDMLTHVWIWSIFTAIFLPLTYRNFKGMWIGILHAMSPLPKRSEMHR